MWFYVCECGNWHWVDTRLIGKSVTCPNTNRESRVPRPSEQWYAYATTAEIPDALSEDVLNQTPNRCPVLGCCRPASTLDHIVSRRDGGFHSYANIQRMCGLHNSSKGARDYGSWLAQKAAERRRILDVLTGAPWGPSSLAPLPIPAAMKPLPSPLSRPDLDFTTAFWLEGPPLP
jgi:5-methylcytosine-specific restriction endonuclease McrA